MSYSIFYAKQFVKLGNGSHYIPMILAGDNNCFDYGLNGRSRGRRARNWQVGRCKPDGSFSFTPEEILARTQEDIDEVVRRCNTDPWYISQKYTPENVKKNYGYYTGLSFGGSCGKLSATMYFNFYKNGIAKAMTIEELASIGIYLEFFTAYNGTKPALPTPTGDIRTEKQFWEQQEAWMKWQNDCAVAKERPYVWLTFSGDDVWILEKLRRHRRAKKVHKEKTVIVQDHAFALKNNNGYLRRYTKRGYRYTFGEYGCRLFRTIGEAETYRKRLLAKQASDSGTWVVARINRQIQFRVNVQ